MSSQLTVSVSTYPDEMEKSVGFRLGDILVSTNLSIPRFESGATTRENAGANCELSYLSVAVVQICPNERGRRSEVDDEWTRPAKALAIDESDDRSNICGVGQILVRRISVELDSRDGAKRREIRFDAADG